MTSPISSSCSTDQSSEPFDEPALRTTISAVSHAWRTALTIASGLSGTTSYIWEIPPHSSTLPRTSKLFVSMFLPSAICPPAHTNSLPVGIKATFGLQNTCTALTFPLAIRAATSGEITSPERASSSPAFIRLPTARVPAKRFDGAAEILTCCSSSETSTCSTTMAVSKPAGMAIPVLANSQSIPRAQLEVSGIPCSKSYQWTAIESIAQVSALGISRRECTSLASTRPKPSSSLTASTRPRCRISTS